MSIVTLYHVTITVFVLSHGTQKLSKVFYDNDVSLLNQIIFALEI